MQETRSDKKQKRNQYLAYGVKHDRSSDRLFYGLMIFILGCGLFIGGIIP